MTIAESAQSGGQLEVSITAINARASEPFPIRLALRLHNSGSRTLWLYTPATDASALSENPSGSSLAVHLEPRGSEKSGAIGSIPAMGTVLRVAGFPHPQLMAVAPGANADENLAVHAVPSMVQTPHGQEPRWGEYKITLVYSAGYPNGNEIRGALGVDLWSGSILTNAVTISLDPPSASAEGMISGTVTNRNGLTLAGILISLIDSEERIAAQSVTAPDGGFQFTHLPFGRYWVTVRDLGAGRDTSFFEHADLSAGEPDARMKMIMLNQEEYKAKRLLHKPVLFRITDGAGNPVAGAELKILWSDGPLIENSRIEVNQNGLAAANLIPGSNYVTVTKRHCPKIDQMAGVRPGRGIDGFAITLNCKK